MHLYKHFWKMVKQNREGIIIYSIIMIIMIVSICVVANQGYKDKAENDFSTSFDISYVDHDQSVLSKGLIDYLAAKNNVTDYADKSDEDINTLVFFTITSYHFEIPENFEAGINNGEERNIEYNSWVNGSSYIYAISNDIDSYVNTYKSYLNAGYAPEEAVVKTTDNLSQKINISIWSTEEDSQSGSSEEWTIYQITLFLNYLTFGMLALTVGIVIIKNNQEVVARRVEASPVTTLQRSTVDTLGVYSVGLFLWILYVIAVYAFGHNTVLVKERGVFLALNTLVVLMVNCSITVLLAAFNIKSEVMSMIVNIVGLGLSFLSGVFVPQWLLGEDILNVSKFFPFYWSVHSLNMIYSGSGAGLSFDTNMIYQNMCVGILFAVAFFVLSVAVRKIKK